MLSPEFKPNLSSPTEESQTKVPNPYTNADTDIFNNLFEQRLKDLRTQRDRDLAELASYGGPIEDIFSQPENKKP